jgi:hypothetical protein
LKSTINKIFAHDDVCFNEERVARVFKKIKEDEITDAQYILLQADNVMLRKEYISQLSWCIVSDELISNIVALSMGKTVDIIAGSGFLSKKLRDAGMTVYANGPKEHVFDCDDFDYGIDFREDPVKIAKEYDTIILSWPPYYNDLARDIWMAMKPGAQMLYIGEWLGGCCANDAFFNALVPYPIKYYSIPHWPYIHDGLFVINKKGGQYD